MQVRCGHHKHCLSLPRHRQNEPDMSLQTTDSDRKPPARQRLSAKLTAALDAMVWDGLTFANAARTVNMNAFAMRKALERSHVQAYLRQQRQVFRESLSTRGLTRLVELSEQNDNLTAAVSATRTLMSESDQEHSAGAQRHAPGLVVQIITAAPTPPTIDLVRNTCDDENS